jgi:hypothetical protein
MSEEQESPPRKSFCATYFCEGQKLSSEAAKELSDAQAPWHLKYRKQIGMLMPFTLVHLIWWSQMVRHGSFQMFTNRVGSEGTPAYYMSITMIFGSMLAGATSEGGAAVAFPIMTLVFGIAPPIARDFSYMIQSVGMTAAAFTILYMRVQVRASRRAALALALALGSIVAPVLDAPARQTVGGTHLGRFSIGTPSAPLNEPF